MSPIVVFSSISIYFAILLIISYLTAKKSSSETFFTANKKSPWYLVAFGMIGASLSGVTFISVPGEVGNSYFSYFQIVMGYIPGYAVIALVLLPLYYKLKVVSIYGYLKIRFGVAAYKTGAFFFLLSRTIGASFRLFLVASVLQIAFFNSFGIPFIVTVICTLLLIWLYTYRAGIKTIVWTDTLQTFFMLAAVVVTIISMANSLKWSFTDVFHHINLSTHSQIFFWEWESGMNFFKHFFSGAFIAIVMTGLDQDMMQKNLTCKTLKDAQKNMFWFSFSLLPVNLLFLSLGALLYFYAENVVGIEFFRNDAQNIQFLIDGKNYASDDLFTYLAINHFNVYIGLAFVIGVIAAAFSSADSALTALTTSFCVDFLNIDVFDGSKKTLYKKRISHILFSVILVAVIMIFSMINDSSVISAIFVVAGYTYGPLLGLFSFGLFTNRIASDSFIPAIALTSPVICYFFQSFVSSHYQYKFGYELLIINGFLTFIFLFLFSKSNSMKKVAS